VLCPNGLLPFDRQVVAVPSALGRTMLTVAIFVKTNFDCC